VIAEAKNAKSSGFDDCAPSGIGSLLAIRKMLSAIQLDHQFGSMADEVGDVVCDRDLASEAGAVQAVIA